MSSGSSGVPPSMVHNARDAAPTQVPVLDDNILAKRFDRAYKSRTARVDLTAKIVFYTVEEAIELSKLICSFAEDRNSLFT